jgi:hypothetical protein
VGIPVSSDDSYPPAKVTDLSVMVVNDTTKNISIALKWTAPGDDLDSGTGLIILINLCNSYIKNSPLTFAVVSDLLSFVLRTQVFRCRH